MSKRVPLTEKIKQLLEGTFAASHPRTRVLVARGRWGGVHIVVISEAFQGRDLAERDDMIWPILDALSDREATQIRLCLLITPDEAMHYFPAEEPTAAQVAAV